MGGGGICLAYVAMYECTNFSLLHCQKFIFIGGGGGGAATIPVGPPRAGGKGGFGTFCF